MNKKVEVLRHFNPFRFLWGTFTKTILIAWLGSLCSCKGQAQPSDPAEAYAIAADTVTVVTSTPALAQKYETAYRAFKQQEHRFEFDRCKLYYNGRQLKLDTISVMEKQLGSNYKISLGNKWFQDKPVTLITGGVWHVKGIPKPEEITEVGTSLSIKMTQLDYQYRYSERDSLILSVPILEGYVLIDGVPINAAMPIEEVNRRLSRDAGLVFSPYLYSGYYTKRYSSIGFGFPKCIPDDRISERDDWIYICLSYNDDLKTIYQITYSYTIKGTE